MGIDKCVNCKERPVISRGELAYPYILAHKEGGTCAGPFRLIVEANSKIGASEIWNRFNGDHGRNNTAA
jgi:hypothetical protein